MTAASKSLATVETLLALEDDHYEVIAGEVVPKGEAGGRHADAQAGLTAIVRAPFHRRSGGSDGPGGWWIYVEMLIELGVHDVVKPDLAGWRRERVPERIVDTSTRVRPDWICEVVSPSNQQRDLKEKHALYRQYGVPHYWIVDPQTELLTVLRLTPEGYVNALIAGRKDVVRAEPFDAIELRVGLLFGDE